MNQEQLDSAAALSPILSPQDRHPVLPSDPVTILLVEDDDPIREITSLLLGTLTYTVITAASGAEALEKFVEHRGLIHVLLTDIVMPRMSGLQLVQELRKIDPDLKIIYMSGYSTTTFPKSTGEHFIQKPFTLDMLRKTLAEVMEGLVAQVVAH